MISQRRPSVMTALRVDLASLSKCRPTTATSAPSFASAMAVAAPIPLVPPVTRATLPERFIVRGRVCSLRRPTAINQEVSAGNEARFLRTEINGKLADFFRRAPAAKRDSGDE